MTGGSPDREIDEIERELFVGSKVAESDFGSGRDRAAILTDALFGSIEEPSIETPKRRRRSKPPTRT